VPVKVPSWQVVHNRGEAQYTAYRHRNRRVALHPGIDNSSISLQDLAFAFEIALGPMNLRLQLDAGIGIPWYGIFTQQSVTDSATLHQLLWHIQPDLLVEIGTMCGGSALFYANTMMAYNPRARVMTYDTNTDLAGRLARCRQFHASARAHGIHGTQGLSHPSWRALQESGNLVPIIGSALEPTELSRLEEQVRSARAVFVIDDGRHIKASNLAHWHALSRLVSVGSYYLVQDTRLDSDCAYAILVGRGAWCKETRAEGGPAAAIASIVSSSSFRREWVQDRAVEQWGVTQHPGGYLRRVGTPTDNPGNLTMARRRYLAGVARRQSAAQLAHH